MAAVGVLIETKGIISKVAHLCSFGKKPQFLTTWACPHRLLECSYDMATNSPKVGYEKERGPWKTERERKKDRAVPFMMSHNNMYTIISTSKRNCQNQGIKFSPHSKVRKFSSTFCTSIKKSVDTFLITTWWWYYVMVRETKLCSSRDHILLK